MFDRTDADWQIKIVMSSYTWMNNGASGLPDGKSDCANCVGEHCEGCTKTMPFAKAHDPNVCGYTCEVNGQWQEGAFTRVHRDMAIIQSMRRWQGLPEVSNPVDLGLPDFCQVENATFDEQFLQ